MKKYHVGKFMCGDCNKEIDVFVYSEYRGLEELKKDWKEIKAFAENNHWYDFHYNCIACGKWIPCGERELVVSHRFPCKTDPEYCHEKIDSGLYRIHRSCLEKLIEKDLSNTLEHTLDRTTENSQIKK